MLKSALVYLGLASTDAEEPGALPPPPSMRREGRAEIDGGAVGPRLSFRGELNGEGDFHVLGKFEGEIQVTGRVFVGEGAEVDANISASAIVIGGTVRGNLSASTRVEIMPSGVLTGTLVGCLLHPLSAGNGGIDYRGLSFYGGLACRDYFCPSYRNLTAAHKEIIKAVCTDWYLYGLVITEDRMMGAFFGEIEKRLGRLLRPADLSAHTGIRQSVLEFLELKLNWPFQAPGAKGPGNYFFDDGLNPKPTVDYARLGVATSRLDPILRELSSAFDRPEAIQEAERRIESLIARILRSAAAY